MKITVQSSKLVKPSYDGNGSCFARTDVVPLSIFDKVNFDQYIACLYFFRPPTPPSADLEAGLAKALGEYREWAGRRGVDADGNPVILLNDAGVRLVQATANVALFGPRDQTTEMLSLIPNSADAEEFLLIQVTRFTCGSFLVGYNFLHRIGDGHAVFDFLAAWGQATRGAIIEPTPVHDRVSFFKPRDAPQVEFEHRGVEFKSRGEKTYPSHESIHPNDDEVVLSMVHFSRDFISKLKSQACVGAPPDQSSYSTLQCVVAHLWRCITKARGLSGSETTRIHIAVDGRARMRPRVPDGYTGNAVLWARPTISAKDLIRMPLRQTVELVSREVSKIDDRYFRSFIDFARSGVVEELGLVPTADAAEMVLSPDVEVDSLLGLPIHRADFGTGKPLFFMPGYLHVEGVIFLVSSFSGDGSIYAHVTIFSRAVDTFKKCCYSLAGADARI